MAASAPVPTPGQAGTPSPKSSRLLIAVVVAVVVVVAAFLVGILAAGFGLIAPASSSGTPSFNVTFTESGLSPGTAWFVTLAGSTESSSGPITFSEPDGTYQYSVEVFNGYDTSPAAGSVTVNDRPQWIPITYTYATSQPLGTNFAWGAPVNASGTTPGGCPSAVGHYCYTIEIAGAGGGVGTSNVLLSLRSALGATVPWPSGVAISLFSPTNATAVATYATTTNLWTLVAPFAGALESGMTIVIYTASTGAANGLVGDSIVASGANGFSGTVPSALFS